MSDKSELLITVVFGKLSTAFTICTQDPQALDTLKAQIYSTFHLDPKFQRLVHRGRNVKTSTVLTNGSKVIVLRTPAYYEQSEAFKAVLNCSDSRSVLLSPVAAAYASKTASANPEIDVNELEKDDLLVQVFKGKNRYEMIFPCSKKILDVKQKLSSLLGLHSPQALKLVVKGKTPVDNTVLGTLVGTKKVIKFMVLLQAQQHMIQEKEKELRKLINELSGAQTALQRVQRQMARNFMSRDESLFELSRVLDDSQRLIGKFELVKQHLAESKTLANRQTLAATMQAIEEAITLAETAQGLLDHHSMV
ncbi:unnamed protein product [Peronospora belbahrii]|uniref:Ubiquitin-like domain-containing protein n=1 Tax=Peronospora belbahrii TaxID=622444 RepID=A0AAU9LCL3_9STRA|nr:unnamed protein product [Peronospora belbahrii]